MDRSLARMIATKRLVTGSLELIAGVALLVVAIRHGGTPSPGLGLALVIFFAGGAWTLRDGIRLHRALRQSPGSTGGLRASGARELQ
jgi:hypothetical protein